MDGGPSLTFVLLALLSGFCAGGWLAFRVNSAILRTARGEDRAARLRSSRPRRLACAGAAAMVLLVSLLLPVQSLVLTAACAGWIFVAIVQPGGQKAS
jgi:hypothetical protein